MVLSPVDEVRVRAERHVVEADAAGDAADVDPLLPHGRDCRERADGVGSIEPDVSCEMIARPERHADERHIALDCHVRDSAERAVAAGDADRPVRRASHVRGVVALAQDVYGNASTPRFTRELVRIGVPVSRARIHDQ